MSGYLLNFARNNPGASQRILEAMLQSTPGNRDLLGEYIGFLHWQRDPRFLEVLRDAQARFGKDAFPDP